MHPTEIEIVQYVRRTLADESRRAEISKHLAQCPHCRTVSEQYSLMDEYIRDRSAVETNVGELSHARKLRTQALAGTHIPLQPLRVENADTTRALAADGPARHEAGVESLLTLYSESPEVTVQIMRDHDTNRTYLQATAAEEDLFAGVLVEEESKNLAVTTDARGFADLPASLTSVSHDSKWKLKLPTAVFQLQSLTFDANSVESSTMQTLSTERGDEVEVTIESLGLGARVTVRPRKISGRDLAVPVRAELSHGESRRLLKAQPNEAVAFDLDNPQTGITIRLYSE